MISKAFPDALVGNYEPLIQTHSLPDNKDKHILAAAIKINANLIVTNNLKDFPTNYIASFGLTAKNADDFFTNMIDIDHETSMKAFRDLVRNKTNPPYDENQVLIIFRRNGLSDTADYLHSLM